MHTIRLRGPWHVEPVERFELQADGAYRPQASNLPTAARMTMPANWSEAFGADFLGRVRYQRVFQRPTGLDEGKIVWLVVDPPRSRGAVMLNDTPLGDIRWGGSPGRFDITRLLHDHNRLEVIVEHPALDSAGRANDDSGVISAGGLVGDVRLEIEE